MRHPQREETDSPTDLAEVKEDFLEQGLQSLPPDGSPRNGQFVNHVCEKEVYFSKTTSIPDPWSKGDRWSLTQASGSMRKCKPSRMAKFFDNNLSTCAANRIR